MKNWRDTFGKVATKNILCLKCFTITKEYDKLEDTGEGQSVLPVYKQGTWKREREREKHREKLQPPNDPT